MSSGTLSGQQQLNCLNIWLSSTQDVDINGVPAKVSYMHHGILACMVQCICLLARYNDINASQVCIKGAQ